MNAGVDACKLEGCGVAGCVERVWVACRGNIIIGHVCALPSITHTHTYYRDMYVETHTHLTKGEAERRESELTWVCVFDVFGNENIPGVDT